MARLLPTCTLNLLTVINIYIICLLIFITQKIQFSLAKLFASICYAVPKRIREIINWRWNAGSEKQVPWTSDQFLNEKSKIFHLQDENDDNDNNMKGTSLVATYHPLLKSLSAIINKNFVFFVYGWGLEKNNYLMIHGFIS